MTDYLQQLDEILGPNPATPLARNPPQEDPFGVHKRLDEILGAAPQAPSAAPTDAQPTPDHIRQLDEILGGQAQAPSEPAAPTRGYGQAFLDAVHRGGRQVQAMPHQLGALTAELGGDTELMKQRMQAGADIEALAPKANIESFKQVWDDPSFDKLAMWATERVGEQVPIMGFSIATGGVGAFAGRMAVRGLLSNASARALNAGLVGGGLTGGFAGATALETADTAQELYQATGSTNPYTSLLAGGVKGALELLTPYSLGKVAFKGPVGSYKKAFAKTAFMEAATEAAQEEASIAARKFADPKYDYFGSEAVWRRVDSALAGGLVGGVFGAATEKGSREAHRGTQSGQYFLSEQEIEKAAGPESPVNYLHSFAEGQHADGPIVSMAGKPDGFNVGQLTHRVFNPSYTATLRSAYDQAKEDTTERYSVQLGNGQTLQKLFTPTDWETFRASTADPAGAAEKVFGGAKFLKVNLNSLQPAAITAELRDLPPPGDKRIFFLPGTTEEEKVGLRQGYADLFLSGVAAQAQHIKTGEMDTQIQDVYGKLLNGGLRVAPSHGSSFFYTGTMTGKAVSEPLATDRSIQVGLYRKSQGDVLYSTKGEIMERMLGAPTTAMQSPRHQFAVAAIDLAKLKPGEYSYLPVVTSLDALKGARFKEGLSRIQVRELTKRYTQAMVRLQQEPMSSAHLKEARGIIEEGMYFDNPTNTSDLEPLILLKKDFEHALVPGIGRKVDPLGWGANVYYANRAPLGKSITFTNELPAALAGVLENTKEGKELARAISEVMDFASTAVKQMKSVGGFSIKLRQAHNMLTPTTAAQYNSGKAEIHVNLNNFLDMPVEKVRPVATAILIHEIGHHVTMQAWSLLPGATQDKIWAEYRRRMLGLQLKNKNVIPGDLTAADPMWNAKELDDILRSNTDYYFTFVEYLAEQFVRWSGSLDITTINEGERFMVSTVRQLGEFAALVRENYKGFPQLEYSGLPGPHFSAMMKEILGNQRGVSHPALVNYAAQDVVNITDQTMVKMRDAVETAIQQVRLLPEGTKIQIDTREIAGSYLSGEDLIKISIYALDSPRGVTRIIAHEALHRLFNMEIFLPHEWQGLVAKARGEVKLSNSELFKYRVHYIKQLKKAGLEGIELKEAVDRKIDEEYVAHLVEQRQAGMEFDRETNGWLDRIIALFRQIGQNLRRFFDQGEDLISRVMEGQFTERTNVEDKRFEAGQRMLKRHLEGREDGVERPIFGGLKARGVDELGQAQAEKMLKQGGSVQKVWRDTGWYKGPDGKWRFEIDDSQAKLTVPPEEWFNEEGVYAGKMVIYRRALDTTQLDEVLDHPTLFEYYPELRNVTISLGMGEYYGTSGGILEGNITANVEDVNDFEKLMQIILHEVQHWVQDYELFSQGGSPQLIQTQNEILLYDLRREIKTAQDEGAGMNRLTALYEAYEAITFSQHLIAGDWFGPSDTGFALYRKLFGEVEAENAMARRGLTAGQRRETFPEATQEIPTKEAIQFGEAVVADYPGRQIAYRIFHDVITSRPDFVQNNSMSWGQVDADLVNRGGTEMLALYNGHVQGYATDVMKHKTPGGISDYLPGAENNLRDAITRLMVWERLVAAGYGAKQQLNTTSRDIRDLVTSTRQPQITAGESKVRPDNAEELAIKEKAKEGRARLETLAEEIVRKHDKTITDQGMLILVSSNLVEGLLSDQSVSRYVSFRGEYHNNRAAYSELLHRHDHGDVEAIADARLLNHTFGLERPAFGQAARSAHMPNLAKIEKVAGTNLVAAVEYNEDKTFAQYKFYDGFTQNFNPNMDLLDQLDHGTGPEVGAVILTVNGKGFEVDNMYVNTNYRGSKKSDTFYAYIEKDLKTTMKPSGILTEDGFKMWKRRNPAAVRYHVAVLESVRGHRTGDEVYHVSPNFVRDKVDYWQRAIDGTLFRGSATLMSNARENLKRYKQAAREIDPAAWEDPELEQMFALSRDDMIVGTAQRMSEGEQQQNDASLQDYARGEDPRQRPNPWTPKEGYEANMAPMWAFMKGFNKIEKDPEVRRALLNTNYEGDRISKFSKKFLGLHQMMWRNPDFQAGRDYITSVERWNARRMQWISRADRSVRKWDSLKIEQKEKLADFMFWLTEMEYRSPAERTAKVVRYPTMPELNAYITKNKLTKETVQMSLDIQKDFNDFLEDVKRVSEIGIARISDPTAQAKALAELYAEIKALQAKPYFPMVRFGEYTVTVRDRSNPKQVLAFYAFPSEAERAKAMKPLIRQHRGQAFQMGKMPEEVQEFQSLPAAMLKKIKGTMPGLSKVQLDWIDQLEYQVAPEASFRKRWLHRKGTPGYSMDAMRAFAFYFMTGSNYLARLEYKDSLQDIIDAAQYDAKTNAGIATKRQMLVDFMQEHLTYIMKPGQDWSKMKSLIAIWYLGFSPAAAFVNLTQIPVFTLPYLSARFGDRRALGALTQTVNALKGQVAGENYKSGIPGYDQARLEMIEQGKINAGQAPELAAMSDSDNLTRKMAGTQAQKAYRQFSWLAMVMFQQTERFNRELTFATTYKLAIDQPTLPWLRDEVALPYMVEIAQLQAKRGLTFEQAQATIAAREAILRTQFEYSPYARPAFTRGGFSGTLLVFMTYLQSALYAIWNNPGGRRTLAVLLVMGGLMGLPGAEDLEQIINFIVRSLVGDFNVRKEIRRMVRDITRGTMFDETGPDLFLHGISRYGFGLGMLPDGFGAPKFDASANVSMGQVVPGLAEGLKHWGTYGKSSEIITKTMQDASGAGFGYFFNLMQFMMSDPWTTEQKKWEKVMPRSMKAVSKATRYAWQGQEQFPNKATFYRFNNDWKDPEDKATILAQFMGFTPTGVSRKWEALGEQKETELYYKGWRMALEKSLDEAVKEKDPATLNKAITKITDFNKKMDSLGQAEFGIQTSQAIASARGRERARVQSESNLPGWKVQTPTVKREQDLYPGVQFDVKVK